MKWVLHLKWVFGGEVRTSFEMGISLEVGTSFEMGISLCWQHSACILLASVHNHEVATSLEVGTSLCSQHSNCMLPASVHTTLTLS